MMLKKQSLGWTEKKMTLFGKICASIIMLSCLTACQSTSGFHHTSSANRTLEQAFDVHLHRSFSYTAMLDVMYKDNAQDGLGCEAVHDEQYVALANLALAEGLDLSADRYLDKKASLRQEFLACREQAEHHWHTKTISPNNHQVIEHYLTTPLKVSSSGNFRPLMGQVSLLPQVAYRFGTVELMINQPMVVDIKSEAVYLWADNFAFANATWIDKQLGDKWHNKWLMLPLNDGSLPKDFVKDLGRAYRNAQKAWLREGQFEYVGKDEIVHVSKQRLDGTAHVIKKTNQSQGMLARFVQEMTDTYPVLVEPREAGETRLDSLVLMQRLFDALTKHLANNTEQETLAFYGVDERGRLSWVVKQTKAGVLVTKFDDKLVSEFERLPTTNKYPTPANSIDVLAYLKTLQTTAQDDNNPYLRWIFGQE